MIVIHMESGLGNQMLSYLELLALKKMNPDQKFYIETFIYDIPACNNTICQWNGYELERIFGVSVPDIKTLFSKEEYQEMLCELTETKFWEQNWNYPPEICKVLSKHGLSLINMRGDFSVNVSSSVFANLKNTIHQTCLKPFFLTLPGYHTKQILRKLLKNRFIRQYDAKKHLFFKTDQDIFTGQRLSFMHQDNNIEFMHEEIFRTFLFPEITDPENLSLLKKIQQFHAVAIHIRRGDTMFMNGAHYQYGYFKRAVNYIKKRDDNLLFVIFSGSDSDHWCSHHLDQLGLTSNDNYIIVDWNKGLDSYIDLQLMSLCKHNIFLFSSFGWWGAYLNQHEDKITCCPEITIVAGKHF